MNAPKRPIMMSTKERVRVLREAKPNTWIALSANESSVVAYGNTYAEVVTNAKTKGETDPVILKTPDDWSTKVFSHCA